MNAIDIKVWLIRNGYTQTQISKDTGVSRQTVWKTIHGRERNRKVLAWLKQRGIIWKDA